MFGGAVPYAMAIDTKAGHAFVATGPMPPNIPGVNGRLSMLDTRTGALLRSTSLRAMPPLSSSGMAVDETTGRVFIAPPGFDSPTGANAVQIFDAATGMAVRTVALGGRGASLVADTTAHRLFVLTSDDKGSSMVDVLDTRTGDRLRPFTAGKGYGGLAVDERAGHVFVWSGGTYANGRFGGNGSVRMFDARSGQILRTATVGLAVAMAVDTAAHRAFVLNSGTIDGHGTARPGGTISVLDTRDGTVVRTVRLGGFPAAVAFDEKAGTAFVTDMSADRVSVLDARSGDIVRTVSLGVASTSAASAGRA